MSTRTGDLSRVAQQPVPDRVRPSRPECPIVSGLSHAQRLSQREKGLDVPQLKQKIAIIGDETYPEAEHRVPSRTSRSESRPGFKRHEFLGLNVFLLEMFRQFYDMLGVRTPDYMSGSTTDLQDAIDGYAQQARQRTAQPGGRGARHRPQQIEADVTITNLAGHRLPERCRIPPRLSRGWSSGMARGRRYGPPDAPTVWASSSTATARSCRRNSSPSTSTRRASQQHFQPHHEVITSQDQVQIYEELIRNSDGKFTTNFIRRYETVKENRLLRSGGPSTAPTLAQRQLSGIHARRGLGRNDPDYQNGRGTDHVSYRMSCRQVWTPAGHRAGDALLSGHTAVLPGRSLQGRAGRPATQRLYYLASNLEVEEHRSGLEASDRFDRCARDAPRLTGG